VCVLHGLGIVTPSIHRIGGWMDSKAILDAVKDKGTLMPKTSHVF
jgi:hypothetical protein